MEPTESRKDDEEKMLLIQDLVEDLAYSVSEEYVTDDNPSPSNQLTSLDQIIEFELDGYLDEDMNVEYIKACITKKIAETKYHEYTMEIDPDDWYEEGEELLDADSFINLPLIKEDIEKIAIFLFLNIVTEDNRSPTNDCNTLQQLIPFHFSRYFEYEWDYDEAIWKAIQSHLILISGGTDLSYLYNNKNFMNDYFVDYDA